MSVNHPGSRMCFHVTCFLLIFLSLFIIIAQVKLFPVEEKRENEWRVISYYIAQSKNNYHWPWLLLLWASWAGMLTLTHSVEVRINSASIFLSDFLLIISAFGLLLVIMFDHDNRQTSTLHLWGVVIMLVAFMIASLYLALHLFGYASSRNLRDHSFMISNNREKYGAVFYGVLIAVEIGFALVFLWANQNSHQNDWVWEYVLFGVIGLQYLLLLYLSHTLDKDQGYAKLDNDDP